MSKKIGGGIHILGVAGGNPKILTDFLQLVSSRLASNRWCWQDGSTASDLTPAGLAELHKLPVKHDEILTLLIDDVRAKEPAIIEALSLSSHQGVQFLHDVTEAVATELGRPPAATVLPSLQRADHPHNLVAPLSLTRAPASEFREARVCELLRAQYPEASPQQVHEALRNVLLRWLHGGQMAKHPEAGRLYIRLLTFLEETDARQNPEAARARLRAQAEYFVWLDDQWEFRAAAVELTRLEALVGALPEWPPVEVLPLGLQCSIIQGGLVAQKKYAAALHWTEELFKHVLSGDSQIDDVGHLLIAVILHLKALQHERDAKVTNEIQAAYKCFIEMAKVLHEHGGSNSVSLSIHSGCLILLGDDELRNSDKVMAMEHFENALTLAQQAREQFGDTQGVLETEATASARLGSLKLDGGDMVGATMFYEKSLKVCREIREQFGDSPDALREETFARLFLATVAIGRDKWEEAFKQIKSALSTFEGSLDQYGPTFASGEHYRHFEAILKLCEESGQAENVQPLREWLGRLKPLATQLSVG